MLLAKSMRSTPSTSTMRQPLPRDAYRGDGVAQQSVATHTAREELLCLSKELLATLRSYCFSVSQ